MRHFGGNVRQNHSTKLESSKNGDEDDDNPENHEQIRENKALTILLEH